MTIKDNALIWWCDGPDETCPDPGVQLALPCEDGPPAGWLCLVTYTHPLGWDENHEKHFCCTNCFVEHIKRAHGLVNKPISKRRKDSK